jgi:hypothetical protein
LCEHVVDEEIVVLLRAALRGVPELFPRRDERERQVEVDVCIHASHCTWQRTQVCVVVPAEQHRPRFRRGVGAGTPQAERVEVPLCELDVEQVQEGRVVEVSGLVALQDTTRDRGVEVVEVGDRVLAEQLGHLVERVLHVVQLIDDVRDVFGFARGRRLHRPLRRTPW